MRVNTIEIQNLSFRYARTSQEMANQAVDLSIPTGEVFGLLGPNGAGKTTLVKQIMGLLQPHSGQLWVNGIDIIQNPQIAHEQIGYMPQHGIAMRPVPVEQALYFTGRLRGLSDSDTRQQVSHLLDQTGLITLAKKTIGVLSGGEQRLTSFALALMGYPRILILDEPTNDLAPETRQIIWQAIQQLNQEYGTTCLLITHNLFEAERVVQRLAFMHKGQIELTGTPGMVKQRINATAQIEIWVKEQMALSPEQQSRLPAMDTVRPGHFRITIPREAVASVFTDVIATIPADQLDDFRVTTLSLEDVYLALQQGNGGSDA